MCYFAGVQCLLGFACWLLSLFIEGGRLLRATVERSTLLFIREGGSAVRDLALSRQVNTKFFAATAQANSEKPSRQSTLQAILQQTRNPTKPDLTSVETINKGG
jgi:hypothetical protein